MSTKPLIPALPSLNANKSSYLQTCRNHSKNIGYQHLEVPFSSREDHLETKFEARLKDKIDSQIVELDKNSLFFGTDLVVFKDSYRGHLPLNGIKESELKKFETLIQDIIQSKTSIQIDQQEPFFSHVISDITLLATRECGRKLIEKLAEGDKGVLILPQYIPGNTSSQSASINNNISHSTVHLSLVPTNYVAKSTDKHREGFKIPSPSFLSLAHELIHSNHFLYDTKRYQEKERESPSLHADYHDWEEQKTITGLSEDLGEVFNRYQNSLQEDEWECDSLNNNSSKEAEGYKLDPAEYDYLNEWTFFSSYGISVRENHKGAGATRPGDYSATALVDAIRSGAHRDVRAMLESDRENSDGVSTQLIDTPLDSWDSTPLHIAMHIQDRHMIEVILEFQPRLDFQDRYGNAPYDLAGRYGLSDTLSFN